MLQAAEYGPITRIHLARTALGRPLYMTGAYLLDGLLIDTGCPATARQVLAWCAGRGVRRAVNTHHHEDHSGGDALLQGVLGVEVLAAPETARILAHFPRLPLYRRLVWGQPQNVQVTSLGEVLETEHYRFEVIPTPGHCPDHICLFEPRQGWLFSGDLFVHERVRYLRADEDARATLQSLRRVLALRPRLLLCAHAGPVEDACAAIERKIAFWEHLADEAKTLRAQGLSLAAVSRRLLGPETAMTCLTGSDFAKVNLIRSLLGEGVG